MYPSIVSIFSGTFWLEALVSVGMLFALAIAIWAIAYFRWSVRIWSLIIASILALFAWGYGQFFMLNIVAWIIFLPVSFLVNIPHCRTVCFTRRVFNKFNELVPPLSKTEKQALAAGDVGWEKELFTGAPKWENLFSIKAPELTDEEKAFLDNEVEELCAMVNDWGLHQPPYDLPESIWKFIREKKFFGIIIDKKYGGLGFSSYAHSAIITKIATRSYTAAVTVMVPNSLGPAEFLQHYGTKEQKEKYLPRLAGGAEIPCFALTSLNAGSDAASITDTGFVCEREYQGKLTIGLRLNWKKRYITLAPVATLLGIAVRVYDPDHFLGTNAELGITFCLVSSNLPGVTSGERHMPINMGFMNGPTEGKDVFIPLDDVIGGQEGIGKGWQMVMNSLAVGRGISLPAVSCATAELSFLTTGAYAKVREQFKVPIGEFEGVQEALSRIGGNTYICEAMRSLTVGVIDSGIQPAIASAITKYHLTELNRKIIGDAMDVHAGRALIMGDRNYLAQMYIGAPINITVEGSNILTRNLIIFGQGAVRCHPYIQKEMSAACMPGSDECMDVNECIARFDHLVFEHIGYLFHNIARSFTYGLSCSFILDIQEKGFLRPYIRQLTRLSRIFSVVSDLSLIVFGAQLKRKESLSARLGDMLSYLYIGSAVAKYYVDGGRQKEDEPYVSWAIKICLYNFQQAYIQFVNNLPNRFLAWFIRIVTFPLGWCYRLPKDTLSKAIAKNLMQESNLRNRLTKFCFLGDKDKDAVCAMEYAFQNILASEVAYQKLHAAYKEGTVDPKAEFESQLDAALQLGILTLKEREQLMESYTLQQEAIKVDSYPPQAKRKHEDDEIDK